ncbi:unnamed protein product, partial [Dibothriocephalus latus]
MRRVVSVIAVQHLACSLLLISCCVALIFFEVTEPSTARIGLWSGSLLFLPTVGTVVAAFSESHGNLTLILLDLTGFSICVIGNIMSLIERKGNPIATFWLEFAALLFLVYDLILL